MNNLVTEQNLPVFDNPASKTAHCRNCKFTANDEQLHKANIGKIDKISKKISSALNTREIIWNEDQRRKRKERIQSKLQKSAHAKDYQKKLLNDCKSWLGPCTPMDELMKVIRNNGDRSEFIVKTELAYCIHSHKAD